MFFRVRRSCSSLARIVKNLREPIIESGDKKYIWSWSRKKKPEDEEKLKIIKSRACDESAGKNILDPECKVAIVVGGAASIGLSAADSLLYHGARVVILTDEDPRLGEKAAKNLCDFYGKNRALYLRCDLKSSCQLEGVFEEAICRYKKVDVLFNNVDRNGNAICLSRVKCGSAETEPQTSNTKRAIDAGMKYMGKTRNNDGGIIVNAATVIGFMGWPIDPTPVYRFKEPVAETTMDLAKNHRLEKTGVRIVALLKSCGPLADIALPDFPTSNLKMKNGALPYCEPSAESRIGKALIHLMSRAPTGSTWLSEPAPCLREIPWQIHFPTRQGETVDPRIYDNQNYADDESRCVAAASGSCPASCGKNIRCK